MSPASLWQSARVIASKCRRVEFPKALAEADLPKTVPSKSFVKRGPGYDPDTLIWLAYS